MYPFFDNLKDKTEQMIDLYGDSYFFGRNLEGFQRKIQDIRKSIENKPAKWRVEIGREKREYLFNLVEKEKFKLLLKNLLRVIEIAKEEDKGLLFIGD